jgi:hypothetical protein
MLERFQRNLENGFQDFPGLTITGNIPIRQEFMNEILDEVLRNVSAGGANATGASSGSSVPFDKLAGLVKKLAVRADAGVITIDFEVRL